MLDQLSDVIDVLTKQKNPIIIGIRHHSPSCSFATGKTLEQYKPDLVLVELPTYFKEWLSFAGSKETLAPIAMAAHHEGGLFSFYPFADFSPELVAVRWALQNNVRIEPFDNTFSSEEEPFGLEEMVPKETKNPLKLLLQKFSCSDFESLWDHLVESGSQDAEHIRRISLLLGWALRMDAIYSGGISRDDLARETFMRKELANYQQQGFKKIVVVVGSFHGAALLKNPLLWQEVKLPPLFSDQKTSQKQLQTSLIPYSFELFDSRSGYPAGIKDPKWRQQLWEVLKKEDCLEKMLAQTVVEICRKIREQGHAAGTPDAIEVMRMTRDLSSLRGLTNLGREEFLESIETCLLQGELYGRGKVVAKCLQEVLVGDNRGKLCKQAPRSGIYHEVINSLKKLKLPTLEALAKEEKEVRLDPLRSKLDEKRQIFFHRLDYSGISLVQLKSSENIVVKETLFSTWKLKWTPLVEAQIEVLAPYGVNLLQVCSGLSLKRQRKLQDEENWSIAALLEDMSSCCYCNLEERAKKLLQELEVELPKRGNLKEIIDCLSFLEKVKNHLIPGFAANNFGGEEEYLQRMEKYNDLALKAMQGLLGSEKIEDIVGIAELVRHHINSSYESIFLKHLLKEFTMEGSFLIQGVSHVALILLEHWDIETFGTRLASLFASAGVDSGKYLCDFLRGSFTLASSLFEMDPHWLSPLFDKVDEASDMEFLQRLPFLRKACNDLSSTSRTRLMETLKERCGDSIFQTSTDSPEALATWAKCDIKVSKTLEQLPKVVCEEFSLEQSLQKQKKPIVHNPAHQIKPIDRYALILGQPPEKNQSGLCRQAAGCLQELYGSGHSLLGGYGEKGSPTGKPFPTVREWKEALEKIFEEEICEEVLAEAASQGRVAALLELNPDKVRPSVDLLEQIISLKGGASEEQLAHLRKLANSIIERLAQQLANKTAPAFSGLSIPRPTIRNTGKLQFRKTLEANLSHARKRKNGTVTVVPERLLFQTKIKKSLDWQIILVVDVSGSMEKSVIHSAIMASILARLPAVKVHFVAFSTEVIDFTDRISDPLDLLFEISIGGGTLISKGLNYARNLIKNPSRTIVVLISDFEEGGSLGSLLQEVREIKDCGAKALGLASLDEDGKPRYNSAIAGQMADAGMPTAALTPLELARWIAKHIRQ